ncbi:MAG: GNAT family N-acetyltransferase [Betaproteobacteria bacterium]|nr:GNAT family N-acetyltransferase [Betaproteobacteria bacterium]
MVAAEITAFPASGCEEALALLDQEFIFSRGRTISLSIRFAGAVSQPDARFLAARCDGRIESLLLLRPFRWITPALVYRAVMIGLVWTRPEVRGRGHAGALLAHAAQMLRAGSFDFAVLWTTRPEFYARAGWIAADCGVLGHRRGRAGATATHDDARALWPAIHSLREAEGGERVARTPASYATLLAPATEHDAAIEGGAYALVGRAGATGYVYEIGGQIGGLPALWRSLCGRYGELFLNVRRSSPAHERLAAQPATAWQDQHLAMWLPLSARARAVHFHDWYIPFVDHI